MCRRADFPMVQIWGTNKIKDQRQRERTADCLGQPQRPARRENRTNPTSETIITQDGTSAHRIAMPNASGVLARIIHNSHPAKSDVATAVRA